MSDAVYLQLFMSLNNGKQIEPPYISSYLATKGRQFKLSPFGFAGFFLKDFLDFFSFLSCINMTIMETKLTIVSHSYFVFV